MSHSQSPILRFLPIASATMNDVTPSCELDRLARTHQGHGFHKWHHYFAIYDRYLQQFRGKPITLLEIGVQNGGSLQLWRSYFGDTARIHGADMDERCAQLCEDGLNVHIGDQSDPVFLKKLIDELAPFDVIIDDGSHVGAHQIFTLETLFPHLKEGGVYICEDLHASYWPNYAGGLNRQNTFTDYLKGLVDRLHRWYHPDQNGTPQDFAVHWIDGIHLYDSVAVIEKKRKPKPFIMGFGTAKIAQEGIVENAYPVKSKK